MTLNTHNGTRPSKPDHRDYSFHKSFGSVPPATFPDNYSTDSHLDMPDQNALGLPYGCTDFTQSQLTDDIAQKDISNPFTLDGITHANALGGIDIRTSLKAAQSIGWITTYFTIEQHGSDMFDSIRLAMLSGAPEERSVSMGNPWFPTFENVLPDGVLPTPASFDTYGMGGAGNGSGNGGNGTDGAVIITETLTSTMSSVMVPALTVNYITATINSNSTTTPAVGIGTSTPAGTLSVQSFWGDIAEIISGFIGSVNYVFQEIDRYGHLVTGGPAPTCGTGCASVTGDDRTMRVVTGSSVSSATVNFANTYTTTPICQATEESGGTVAVNASSTPSGVVLEFASALTTTRIGVICQISSNFTF